MDNIRHILALGCLVLSSHWAFGDIDLQYIGCYIDNEDDRAISEQSTDLGYSTTVEKCIAYCSDKKYTYAGLQKTKCYCGDSYTKHGKANSSSDCDERCKGHRYQTCGGQNTITVYAVCPFGMFGVGCVQTCPNHHCVPVEHGECHFKTGRCLNTQCQYGYKYCMNTDKACVKIKAEPRETLSAMNAVGGNWLNIFTTLTFKKQAQVSQIEYYTHSTGQMYVSFWRKVPGNNVKWIMVGKILINAKSTGYQRYDIPVPERVVVDPGDAIGTHYPSGSRDGILYYEVHNQRLSNNISLNDLYFLINLNIQDRGWKPGAIINLGPVIQGAKRAPSIHIILDCFRECGNCKNGGPCDYNGNCQNISCDAGFKGDKCNQDCENGKYGENCMNTCSRFCKYPPCVKTSLNGQCPYLKCEAGFKGSNCQTECGDGYYGENCQKVCGNCKIQPCNKTDGSCPNILCKAGYSGTYCNEECEDGYFGANCQQKCHHKCKTQPCDKKDGSCPGVICKASNSGACEEECDDGHFGENCQKKCGNCKTQPCNKMDGSCPYMMCKAGYSGTLCDKECVDGYFGENCLNKCTMNCSGLPCDKFSMNGECTDVSCEGNNCTVTGSEHDEKMVPLKTVLIISILTPCVLVSFVGITVFAVCKHRQLSLLPCTNNASEPNCRSVEIMNQEYNQEIDFPLVID